MGKAKSYAERLFDFPEVGPLPPEAARRAIEKPAEDEGVSFEPAASRASKPTNVATYESLWSEIDRIAAAETDVIQRMQQAEERRVAAVENLEGCGTVALVK
jgi:hypothetical protein